MSRRTWIVVIGVGLLSGPASEAGDPGISVIGVDPNLAEGAYALQFGNYDERIRLTMEGLQSGVRPSDRTGAFSNLCAGYVGIEDFESALHYCNQALSIDDNNWNAYNNRSLAYLGLRDIDAAQRDLEKGLEINPDARTLKEVERRIEAARQAAAKARAPVRTPPEAD
jgi:tetratricopeptide (TPR) repeat protein